MWNIPGGKANIYLEILKSRDVNGPYVEIYKGANVWEMLAEKNKKKKESKVKKRKEKKRKRKCDLAIFSVFSWVHERARGTLRIYENERHTVAAYRVPSASYAWHTE